MSPHIKKIKPFLGIALVSALALGALSTNTFAATPITHLMDNTSIDDEAFATCVYNAYHDATGQYFHELDEFDNNFDYAPELAKITQLSCENQNITSVNGLELLIGLTDLRLTSNSIEEIDVSALTELETLIISYNPIEYIDLRNNTKLETFFSNKTVPTNIADSAWVLTPAQPTRRGDDIIIDFSTVKFLHAESQYDSEFCTPVDTENFSIDRSTGIVTVLNEDAISSSPIELSCSNGTFVALYHLFRDFLINYYIDGTLDYDRSGHAYALMGDEFLAEDYIEEIDGYELSSKAFWNDEVSIDTTRFAGLEPRQYHFNDETFTFGAFTRYAGINLYYKSVEDKKSDEESADDTPAAPNTGFFTKEDGGVNVANIAITLAGISILTFIALGLRSRLSARSRVKKF